MPSTPDLRDQPAETEARATPIEPQQQQQPPVSRRGLFGVAGAGLVGLAAGAAGGFALGSQEATPTQPQAAGTRTYPFYGERQAGILTPVQDRLHFAAFDVTTDSRTS